MLRKVAGESALPKVGGVVKPMVLVEVMRDVGHAQEYEEHPSGGPEQPGTLVVIVPVPCPADQIVDEGGGSLADVDGGGKVEGIAVQWIMFLWNVRAVGGRHRRCGAGSTLLVVWWWTRRRRRIWVRGVIVGLGAIGVGRWWR